jgi:twitching motility protein PilT
MIVNNEDLLPLDSGNGGLNGKNTPSAYTPPEDDFGDYTARVAETFDSVDLLLAARAEAEEAEAKAKAQGETPLPFIKEDKKREQQATKSGSMGSKPDGLILKSFTVGGAASDDESPAALNMLGGLSALSDASAMQTTLSTKDFLSGEMASAGFEEIASRTVVGGETRDLGDVHIDELLTLTVQSGASDLHLSVGLPPMVRKDGKLVGLPFEKMQERDTQRIVFDVLNNSQIEKFERTHELDFSYGVKGMGRFRFNVYRQRSSVGCAMRVIPNVVPSMEQLKLPPVLRSFTQKHSGLILVTGPTGSGKSTTIASLIDIINSEREAHILTIEDPIEYLHSHKKSMVNQRELGTDTDSFTNALRASLREDPDVILVGEMRDLETIAAAITLAETGHLVFATLHTRSAPATIDRIVDVFPAHQQEQIRIQLSTSIEAVVAQQLLPKLGGGRVSAIEVMIATSALRNLIREGKTYQIYSIIETGQQYGMQAMDRVLADLHRSGQVTMDEAITRAVDRENFQRLVKGY